jgi:hypothetical protein
LVLLCPLPVFGQGVFRKPGELMNNFSPASHPKMEAGRKVLMQGGVQGWRLKIFKREAATICGGRTGLFFLAKDARCGELHRIVLLLVGYVSPE